MPPFDVPRHGEATLASYKRESRGQWRHHPGIIMGMTAIAWVATRIRRLGGGLRSAGMGLPEGEPAAAKEVKTIEPWTLYDLRRTASTGMHKLGVEPISSRRQ